jgi:hypothetical protein
VLLVRCDQLFRGGFRSGVETFHRGGKIWECWNGVEKTGDAERVVHSARGTNQSKAAAFAGESGALTDESADAGAIHLNQAAEIDEQFLATRGGDALKFAVEEFAIFAEGGAAARLDDNDVAIGASIDFEFWMFEVHDDSSRSGNPTFRKFTFWGPKALYDGEAIAPSGSFFRSVWTSIPDEIFGRSDSQEIRRANGGSRVRADSTRCV